MAHRRYRQKHWIEAVPALAGLFLLGWWVSPEFRSLAMVALVAGAVILVAWVFIIVTWIVIKIARGPKLETNLNNPNGEIAPASALSAELLDALEWRDFEILVTLYFGKVGYQARRRRVGADGGVDIELLANGDAKPFAIVQCKAWHAYKVGVKPVRELFGVMAAEQVTQGYFVTTGDFTMEALQFAEGKRLKLVSGAQLLRDFNALPSEAQAAILHEITSDDYTTPTCPRCDVKMIERKANGDPARRFWGCRHYPRCRQTFSMHNNDSAASVGV